MSYPGPLGAITLLYIVEYRAHLLVCTVYEELRARLLIETLVFTLTEKNLLCHGELTVLQRFCVGVEGSN